MEWQSIRVYSEQLSSHGVINSNGPSILLKLNYGIVIEAFWLENCTGFAHNSAVVVRVQENVCVSYIWLASFSGSALDVARNVIRDVLFQKHPFSELNLD